jgi:hypothetical protein
MQSKFLNTEDAGFNSSKAAYRARMYHLENESTFSQKQLVRAERIKLAMEMVYSAKKCYVTCRKTGISVKVDGIKGVLNKTALKQLNKDYTAEGIAIRPTAQGVNYFIPR